MAERVPSLTPAQQKVIEDFFFREEMLEPLCRAYLEYAVRDAASRSRKLGRKVDESEIVAAITAMKGRRVNFTTSYSDSLLSQARAFRRKQKTWEACIFYATWLEHFLNGLVLDLCHEKLEASEAAQVVRDLPIRAKLSWFPVLGGLKPIAKSHVTLLTRLADLRNEFVHYKKSHDPFGVEDDSQDRVKAVLARVESSVRYLGLYYDRQMLKGKTRNIKRAARDLAKKTVADRSKG
jgi:hypothetical protein